MINNLVLFSSIAITIIVIAIAVSALIIREIEWAMKQNADAILIVLAFICLTWIVSIQYAIYSILNMLIVGIK